MNLILKFIILFSTSWGVSLISKNETVLSLNLKQPLVLSGNNRIELEKVLGHYSKKESDSLQLKAAYFLIENMQWHYSDDLKIEADPVFRQIVLLGDSLYYNLVKNKSLVEIKSVGTDEAVKRLAKFMKDSIKQSKFREPVVISNISKKSDLEIISAQFLIEHIDNAFTTRESSPITQKLSFEEFCELSLPYRIVNGKYVRYTGKYFRDFFSKYLGEINQSNIPEIIERYNMTIKNLRRIMGEYPFKSPTGFEELFFEDSKGFDCYDESNYGHIILNACGLPVATQFNIAYAIFQNKHSDQTLPLALGNWTPFTFDYSVPVLKKNAYEEFAEYKEKKRMNLYRINFAVQKSSAYFRKNANEYIPSDLSNPCISDVTDLNLLTASLNLPFKEKTTNNLAYLATFNSMKGMVPVAWGAVDKVNGKVNFRKVIPNTLYFPVYYKENKLETFGLPFYLKSDSTKKTGYQIAYSDNGKPATEKVNIILTRKFPRKPNMIRLAEELVGVYVLGFDSTDGRKDTLARLSYAPPPYLQDMPLKTTKPYKYYQVRPAIENTKLKMAEVYFLTDKKYGYTNTVSAPLLPILHPNEKPKDGSLTRVVNDDLKKLSRLFEFDGSMETVSRDSIITLELDEPQIITTIRFAPQNANNGIVPFNLYMLKYWENGAWRNFEEYRTAEYNYLEIKNAPKGKLYWLKNLTGGKEELPFTINKKGQQEFLYFDLN